MHCHATWHGARLGKGIKTFEPTAARRRCFAVLVGAGRMAQLPPSEVQTSLQKMHSESQTNKIAHLSNIAQPLTSFILYSPLASAIHNRFHPSYKSPDHIEHIEIDGPEIRARKAS